MIDLTSDPNLAMLEIATERSVFFGIEKHSRDLTLPEIRQCSHVHKTTVAYRNGKTQPISSAMNPKLRAQPSRL